MTSPRHPTVSRRLRAWAVGLGVTAVTAAASATFLPTASAAPATLAELANARNFAIGSGIEAYRLTGAYRSIVDAEFNWITAGNEMKWDATEPNPGQFTWSRADAIVAYGQSSGKKVRGHTLVWHSQLPGWVSSLSTAAAVRSAMNNHIAAVAGRYRGRVVDWDVVNEPFNEDGTRRQSVFQQRLGDGYIAEALRAARAADPTAKLYINDYNVEGVNAKSTALYNLVRSLQQQGVPVDGVGLQGHLILGQVPGDLQQNIARFAALGLDVKITELDIRMRVPADATKLAQQAADYRRVFTACLAVSRCVGVFTWGVGEADSWIPTFFPGEGEALLYDRSYQRKPAYDAVFQALGGTRPSSSSSRPASSSSRPPSSAPASSRQPSSAPPAGGCTAAYRVTGQWNTGFQAEVTVRAGSSGVSGWNVRWAYGNGQRIDHLWNGIVTTSPPNVTVRNETHNGRLTGNQAVSFGFTGSWSGSNPVPASVTCTPT